MRQIAERMTGPRVVWVLPASRTRSGPGSTRSPRGLLDALLPFVEAGNVVIVGELEPTAYELLVQQRPRVTCPFETFRLEPLDATRSDRGSARTGSTRRATIDDATIGERTTWPAVPRRRRPPRALLRLLKARPRRARHAAEVRAGERPRDALGGDRAAAPRPRPATRRSISTRCGVLRGPACSASRRRSTASSTGSR